MRQGTLFDPPRPLTQAELVARARGYVQSVLRRRVCRGCCAEERLLFRHRVPRRTDLPLWRLVRLGAARPRLAEEMAKCDVLCRRCWSRAENDRRWRVHRMLVLHDWASVRLVAKATIATGRGRNGGSEPRITNRQSVA